MEIRGHVTNEKEPYDKELNWTKSKQTLIVSIKQNKPNYLTFVISKKTKFTNIDYNGIKVTFVLLSQLLNKSTV